MSIEPNYITNEVKGSFWRPQDDMSRVPNEHVIGNANSTDFATKNTPAITLSISAKGMEMASGNVVFSSEDGIVRKFNSNNF